MEIRRETRERERREKEARCKGVFGRCAEEEAGLRGNLPERELRQLGRSCSELRYVQLSNAIASDRWLVGSLGLLVRHPYRYTPRLSHPRLRAKGRQGFGSVAGWRRYPRFRGMRRLREGKPVVVCAR